MQRYFDINELGLSVRCKLYCEDVHDIRRVAIYCHGFGGHKDNRAAETFAHRVCAKWKGTAVIVFDWPAHGDDARKNLVLAECDTYLRLVIEHARATYETDELYAYGTSFGGFLTLKYIADHGNPFRKAALRCPVIDMYSTMTSTIITADELQKLNAGKTVLVGFDRKVKIGKQFLDDLQQSNIGDVEFFGRKQ